MMDHTVRVVGSDACNDGCKWDANLDSENSVGHRSCIPRRLMQLIVTSKQDLDNRKMTQLESALAEAVLANDNFIKSKPMKSSSHSSRMYLTLKQLKCWNREWHNWDYPILIKTDHSVTSKITDNSEWFISSSAEANGTKKLVSWADDEGMALFHIQHFRSTFPFRFERIEI